MPGDLMTARLRLRRFSDPDADWLALLHGDPAVMRFIDDGQPVPGPVVAEQELPRIVAEYDELAAGLGVFAAVLVASGEPVGWFGLRPLSSRGLADGDPGGSGTRVVELGYRLFPSAWGRGYGTEGARALVRRAFVELRAERVVATTMTVNMASRRVMEKAGLSLVRTFFLEWPGYIEGAERGDVEYAITRDEWLGNS